LTSTEVIRRDGSTSQLAMRWSGAIDGRGNVVGSNDSRDIFGLTYPTTFGISIPTAAPGWFWPPRQSGAFVDVNTASQAVGYISGRWTEAFFSESAKPVVDLTPHLAGSRTAATNIVAISDSAVVLAFDLAIHAAYLGRDSRTSRVVVDSKAYALDSLTSINAVGQIAGRAIDLATNRKIAVRLGPAP
jgi:hypothetical protein